MEGQQIIYSCPRCGSQHLSYQFVNTGTVGAATNTVVVMPAKKSKGCLYWVLIGWWWAPIHGLTKGITHLAFGGRKKAGLNFNANKILNKKMAICQNCGYSWQVD